MPIAEIDFNAEGDGVFQSLESSWSPDGNRIAYINQTFPVSPSGAIDFVNTFRDTYVVDLDGGRITQLTSTTIAEEYVPSWSPDGRTIVYDRTVAATQDNIWPMNADGSDQRRVTGIS